VSRICISQTLCSKKSKVHQHVACAVLFENDVCRIVVDFSIAVACSWITDDAWIWKIATETQGAPALTKDESLVAGGWLQPSPHLTP
jgi:hypothetical protein